MARTTAAAAVLARVLYANMFLSFSGPSGRFCSLPAPHSGPGCGLFLRRLFPQLGQPWVRSVSPPAAGADLRDGYGKLVVTGTRVLTSLLPGGCTVMRPSVLPGALGCLADRVSPRRP